MANRDDGLIELIDADPHAFAGATGAAATRRGPVPRRRKVVALALAVLAGVATYAVFQARPWAGPGATLTLDDSHPDRSALTEQLLLDVPVNQVRATTIHTEALPDSRNLLASGAIGYFFGDARATFDTGDGKDRWLGFYAMPAGAAGAPTVSGPNDNIAGAPAQLNIGPNGQAQMVWGPVDGYVFTGAAANLTRNEIVDVADQLRVAGTRVVVKNRAGLGTLRPIGRFSDYWTLVNMVQRAQQNGVHLPGVVGVFYNTGASISSMPANRSVVDMVAFVLGTRSAAPTASKVHGANAVGFAKGTGAFSGLPATTVMWWEGGRLVLVSGEGTLDAVAKLAQGAHVASASDWAVAAAVQ